MEQQTGSKSGKEYIKSVYYHPAYLTYAEYIMQNAGLDEAQAGIKIAWRNTNNLNMQMSRHTCLLICLILANGAARLQPAHLPDTRQLSRATTAGSSA